MSAARAALGAVFVALLASASSPGAALGGAATQDTVTLAPITVSVLRSPTRLDRLPFSASVLAGADLADGATGLFLEEILHGLAGVRVQNRYNPAMGERISIRGFGARSQFGVRGIKVLVDGIPATLPDGQSTLDHLDIGSLGRVEALRGPAAALYGNGAGGVLVFASARPFAGPFRQEGTIAAGSDGLLRLQTTASSTVGTVGMRTSVATSRFDGFRDNASGSGEDPYSSAKRTTVNSGLTWETLGGRLSTRFIGLELDALNPGSLPASLFDEGSNQAWGFNVARRTRKHVRQGQLGLVWRGPAGGLESDISAYGSYRSLDNPIPFRVIDLQRNGGGARVALAKEWDQQSRTARFDFGGEGELQNDDRKNFVNSEGERGNLVLDQQERVRTVALFGQLRLPASRALTVVSALRFDHFAFSVDDRFRAEGNPDDSGTRTMSALNPSLGLHLELGGHGVFASVARSFETPTTTELANQPDRAGGFNPDLKPQRGWTVEGGLRGGVRDGFVYDLAVYSSRISDQLVPFEVPASPGRTFFRNAGRSRIRGFEASGRTAIGRGLSARVAYGYTDARFVSFAVDSEEFDGNRIPGVAPHRVETAVRGTAGPWFGELRLEVRDAIPTNDANDASADGYSLLDLRLGASELRAGSLRLSPFAGITNLANKRYASSVVVNAFGGRYFEPGPDRGGYAGLSVAWERSR